MSRSGDAGYGHGVDGDRHDGHLRGAVLAGLAALLTAVGHTAGGGAVPDLGVLVVLLPLLAGLFTSVAGRCQSLAGTIAVLGVSQVALHYLMELLHPAHEATAALRGWQMLAAHAAATILIAAALRYADRAVAGLVAALRRVVRRRLTLPPADRPLPVLAVPDLAVPLRLAMALAAAHIRRGPPVGR
jgi:hypothetical protein